LIFCDFRRLQRWLDVEVALATSQASLGIIPFSAAEELIQTAYLHLFDLNEVSNSIRDTGHSLMPLLSAWQKVTSSESGAYSRRSLHLNLVPTYIMAPQHRIFRTQHNPWK
jgi:adenylosuccinate lyase